MAALLRYAAVAVVAIMYAGDRGGMLPDTLRQPVRIPNLRRLETIQVVQVLDGDTVETADGSRIRLVGIDAPETDEVGGAQAGQVLTAILAGSTVHFSACALHPRDLYGRRLGRLYVRGRDVQQAMLARGVVRPLVIAPCGLEDYRQDWLLFSRAAGVGLVRNLALPVHGGELGRFVGRWVVLPGHLLAGDVAWKRGGRGIDIGAASLAEGWPDRRQPEGVFGKLRSEGSGFIVLAGSSLELVAGFKLLQ